MKGNILHIEALGALQTGSASFPLPPWFQDMGHPFSQCGQKTVLPVLLLGLNFRRKGVYHSVEPYLTDTYSCSGGKRLHARKVSHPNNSATNKQKTTQL